MSKVCEIVNMNSVKEIIYIYIYYIDINVINDVHNQHLINYLNSLFVTSNDTPN